MSSQEWRDVVGYEGLYEVSNEGQVRSLDREVQAWGGKRISKGQVLALVAQKDGYYKVTLSREGIGRPMQVHRLVAAAFLGVPENADALVVCHGDGDPSNNAAGNLRWGTQSDNCRDAVLHNRNRNTRKTSCPAKHPYDLVNTYYTPSGHRQCKACKKAQAIARRARSKAYLVAAR